MKNLYYFSTRNKNERVLSSEAIVKGIASDGGLFVPETIPAFQLSLDKISSLTYQELAYEVLSLYLTDFPKMCLKSFIRLAYDDKFENKEITPLVQAGKDYILELFHGPTLAFKDIALSILPYIMKESLKLTGINKKLVILTATSGDTGVAALEGFSSASGTRIVVFYPENGVSKVQKLQMITTPGKNICVAGVEGNFDDAQRGVKELFLDQTFSAAAMKKDYLFSSANSINIGRLLPQIVYYFYAYGQLCKQKAILPGEKVNFTVPTGNFGNILAGYMAKQMGLPVHQLICASNTNNVLYDFFQTRVYNANRKLKTTTSPSMDILVSSNLERLLYFISKDTEKIAHLMKELSEKNSYQWNLDLEGFHGEYASDREGHETIHDFYQKTGYVLDTHTAIGVACYNKYKEKTSDTCKNVILSTASCYKFYDDVLDSLQIERKEDSSLTENFLQLEQAGAYPIPEKIKLIENREIIHRIVGKKEDMKDIVKKFLEIS